LLSNLEIHPVEKNSLFFGQYRYSGRFGLSELGVIRGLHYNKIDQIVKERNAWRQEHRGLYSGYRNIITDKEVADLKLICQLLKKYKKQIKFTISFHTGYVYTNNIKVLEKIKELSCIDNLYAQEAMEVCPPGTIALKNPQWSHRTYLRCRSLDETQKKQISNYLASRENIRLSPGLKYWINRNNNQYWYNCTQSYFFFDHNNDGEVLFLNMVVSRITGRTMQIVAK